MASIALSPKMPIPAHVPPEAVYDFDMRADPGLLVDPHARLLEVVREAPPVFWTPRNNGRWIAIGNEEVFTASRDPEYFSSSPAPKEQMAALMAMMPKDMPRMPIPIPISYDPPEHGIYRQPLQQAFSPRTVMAQKAAIVQLADELLDAIVDGGHCDFIPSVAEQLPVRIFLRMLGLPEEKLPEFRELVRTLLSQTIDVETGGGDFSIGYRIVNAMRSEIEARRNDPRDDIISLLWASEVDGKPMTQEVLEGYAVLLFIAGLDTVINGIGFGVRHLAMNPDLQERLRADPSLIPEAAEEILRRYTFTVPMRRVAKQASLGGWTQMPGEWLALYLPAADLDPRTFPAPDTFDLKRENKVHIAFGAGVHRCLGSHLARIELQLLYERVLARLPQFRLDPDKPARFHAGNVIAVDSLPIRWD